MPILKIIIIIKIIAYVLMMAILVFILGESMMKDVDGYLLKGSINRKFIVKVRPFSSAKTIDLEDYTRINK